MRDLFSSPIITTTIPIAMKVNAVLLSTALIFLRSIGNRIRNSPKTNASFTRKCSGYPV
jgi:hypothetical protein